MYFDSLQAALLMDGHGAYVWSAYALTVLVLLALVFAPLRRQRRLLRELHGEQRRAARPAGDQFHSGVHPQSAASGVPHDNREVS